MGKIKKKVFVGISGGVDSSVSAALLIDQGYDVVGVFIRTWTPDFIECTWRDERRDAMRVCAHLGIPFLECDAEEAYKKGVADYMIEEYKKGNTPNPDVMCNREVKFGVFWEFARAHGADFIATGHYAVNAPLRPSDTSPSQGRKNFSPPAKGEMPEAEEVYLLKKSPDSSKDQSYFLWMLRQEDLAHTIFPIGHLHKTEVRKLAEKYKLPTATKKDSQGVCFLGPLDMKEFLTHYIKTKRGDVLDESGNSIGYHDGAIFLTLGERHGFTITKHSANDVPLYVIAKDIKKNTIMVSNDPYRSSTTSPLLKGRQGGGLKLKGTNLVQVPQKFLACQVRYHGELLPCEVIITGQNTAEVKFKDGVLVSPGQSIVIYDGDICLGGGIVM